MELDLCKKFLILEEEVRQCSSIKELAFLMVNRSSLLLNYEYALTWKKGASKRKIEAVSGVSSFDTRNSTLLQAIETILNSTDFEQQDKIVEIELDRFGQQVTAEPQLKDRFIVSCLFDDEAETGLIFIRLSSVSDVDQKIVQRLMSMFSYALDALQASPRKPKKRIAFNYGYLAILVFFIATFFIPVTQTVISPAYIIAKNPEVITAPQQGVIKEILVKPNQHVSKNDVLFKLDEVELKKKKDVLYQQLSAAKNRYLKAQNDAFYDREAKAKINDLRLDVEKKQLELDYAQHVLAQVSIRSNQSGVVVMDDEYELLGKPVRFGERVMLLADPQQVLVEIELSATDLIVLKQNARVKLFLNIDPSSPIEAELIFISYKPDLNDEGQLVYQLKAAINPDQDLPRIGHRGSARIYGDQVSLFHYVFRRPMSIIRQYVGI